MRRPHPLKFALVAVALVWSERAQAFDDFVTPRSVAMGQSLRADAAGALGPLLNPAWMAMRRGYSIEAMYGFSVQDTGSNLLASVTDSITSKVAAGVYYSFIHSNPHLDLAGFGPVTATREGNEAGVSLALPLGDKFSFGITGKYTRISTVIDPAHSANVGLPYTSPLILDSSTKTALADGFTMDAGVGLKIGDSFSLGVVGYNLIPLRTFEAPVALGTGLAYRFGTVVTIAYDLVVDFNKYKSAKTGGDLVTVKTGGGLEWLIAGKVALRAGAYWDQGRPAWFATGGIAYVGQSFAIDLALNQQVAGGKDTLVVAGIRVFLE